VFACVRAIYVCTYVGVCNLCEYLSKVLCRHFVVVAKNGSSWLSCRIPQLLLLILDLCVCACSCNACECANASLVEHESRLNLSSIIVRFMLIF
jgi:hypothetical protein